MSQSKISANDDPQIHSSPSPDDTEQPENKDVLTEPQDSSSHDPHQEDDEPPSAPEMPVSKLNKIIYHKQFDPLLYFVDSEGRCLFVKIGSLQYELFVYIPSRFTFVVDTSNHQIPYLILQEKDDEETSSQNGDAPPLHLDREQFPDISLDQTEGLRKNEKFLKRFVKSVSSLPYKLAILHHSSFVTISRHNEIVSYAVQHAPEGFLSKFRDLYVVTDLEAFFESTHSNIIKDTQRILDKIQGILSHNLNEHLSMIKSIQTFKQDNFQILISELEKLSVHQARFESLLQKLIEKENTLLGQIGMRSRTKTVTEDKMKSHDIHSIQNEIDLLQPSKAKILSYIKDIHRKKMHLQINVNRLLFENMKCIDVFQKNLKKLKSYVSK